MSDISPKVIGYDLDNKNITMDLLDKSLLDIIGENDLYELILNGMASSTVNPNSLAEKVTTTSVNRMMNFNNN